jgi:hypothetical protein
LLFQGKKILFRTHLFDYGLQIIDRFAILPNMAASADVVMAFISGI